MIGEDITDINLIEHFRKVLEANSSETLVLLGLAMVIWLIGGNVLVALHYRRVGRPIWSGFKPFAFPFRNFNIWEWLCLAGLAIAALTLMLLAIVVNHK
jgi:hypothetical protein